LNVPDRSMSDVAEVSVKPCGGDTACEVLPPLGRNGGRLWDVQGLQAGRRHWLGSMAAVLLGGGALAVCPDVVRAAARASSERKTVSRSQATLPFPMSRAVPGGVAVVPLGAARRAPKAIWNGIPVLVTGSSSGWFAVLGIPLHTLQDRLVLEVLLWLVRRYSEQGVLLHVCSKAFQRRPFRMTWLEVGARRALGAVGGAWRDSATMCYSGPGAGRSGGVLPGPVALRALEVASYRRSRGQGSGSTTHL